MRSLEKRKNADIVLEIDLTESDIQIGAGMVAVLLILFSGSYYWKFCRNKDLDIQDFDSDKVDCEVIELNDLWSESEDKMEPGASTTMGDQSTNQTDEEGWNLNQPSDTVYDFTGTNIDPVLPEV